MQFVRSRTLSAAIIIAMVGLVFPAFQLFTPTYAAQLSLVSATASTSAPSVSTNYMVRFTNINTIGQAVTASTSRITFDPLGNSFDFSSLVVGDITVSGPQVTTRTGIGGCTGPTTNEMYPSSIGVNPDYIELSTCVGDTVPAGAILVNMANAHVVNPAAVGSYIVRINGTMTDSADTRVATINSVTMTGIVGTNLTFTVATVASSSLVNGDTTSTSSSATAIGFGTLSVGTSSIAAQDITVQTNALNGFSVTVTENQDLTSSNGATINAFRDGNPAPGGILAAPAAWGAAPLGTIGNANSYGHMGVTSEDSTLPADDFGSAFYGGLTSTSTRTVLYHTGPADASTANIGATRVGFRVQITSLQEAGTDYTNQIRYVCTPIF